MVRLVSGVVLAASAVAAILFLPVHALRALAVLVAGLAAREYLHIVGIIDWRRQVTTIVMTMILCGVIAWRQGASAELLLLVALAWVAVEVLVFATPVQQAAAAVFAPVYLGAPLGMLAVIHVSRGWQATMMLIATVIVSDSSQYYTGRSLGRRPLAPAISPKKTIEGAVGGVVFGTAFAVLVGHRLFPTAATGWLMLLGIALVVLGICGDLFESRLKRVAGMKDSSALIPGHGGILDRIDALLFAAPAFLLFVETLP
jgi:phosphatidate cytidylyltransferase